MLTYNQIARDIHWIQSSPAIVSPQHNPLFIETPQQPEYKLSASDFNTLHEQLTQRRPLLGIYYETLWQFVLNKRVGCELLAHNLQVRQDKRTLGEFDVIISQSGQYIHREMAVKFYLGLPDQNGNSRSWHQWIGPGLKDRMDKKLGRMIQHQITLSRTEEGKAALASIVSGDIKQEILLQGYLFYPFDGQCNPPVGASKEHPKGNWLSISKLNKFLDLFPDSAVYTQLPKQLWLSSFSGQSDNDQLLNRQNLLDHLNVYFQSETAPKLISCCRKQNNTRTEYQRFFVVPDDWQEKATAASTV